MTVKPFSRLNYNARNYNAISATMVPVYSVSASSSSINEGTTVTYTITTQYVLDGTVLYWTTSGTTVAADFTDGLTSGSVTMTNGTATVTRTLASDITTEGAETIVFELRTVSTSGTIVASTPSGTVNDTSVLTITPNVSSCNEGASVTWTISAVGFGTGTLYYTNSGTTGASDFTDGVNSGSISITADSGTLTKTLVNDLSTEGSETIIIQIRTGSTSGTIVGTSNTVTVADTSYSSQAYSVKFNGSSQYLSVAYNSAINLSSGDFTIECWAYFNSVSSGTILNKDGVFNASYPAYGIVLSSGTALFELGNGNGISPTSTFYTIGTVTTGQWYHIVGVKTGSTIKTFLNGVQGTSTSQVTAVTDGGKPLLIGYQTGQPSTAYLNGYVSNLRIIKGTALYTSAFTPPTDQLSAITNTSLLINGATIADSSGNSLSITNNGTTITSMENPFGDYSMLFNGSSQYLDIPNNTAMSQVPPWTVEAWIYLTTLGTNNYWYGQVGTNWLLLSINTSNFLIVDRSSVGTQITSTNALLSNTWYHVALVADGTNLKLYINGAQSGSTVAWTLSATSAAVTRIGAYQNSGGAGSLYFPGYISNFRYVKGTAVYSSNFTPPTAALPAITNTQLLTCQYAELFDASTNHLAITNAGTTPATTQNPFGNYYASFNGSNQALTIAPTTVFNGMSSVNCTFEAWIYPRAYVPTWTNIITRWGNGGMSFQLSLYQNIPRFSGNYGGYVTGTTTLSSNQWYHVAVVYNGSNSNATIYVNGVSEGSSRLSDGLGDTDGTVNVAIGAYNDLNREWYNGYISNLRIVKGVAVYTGSFTPPISPLTATQSSGTNIAAITGTSTILLTCQYAELFDASTNHLAITNNGSTRTYLTDNFSGIVSNVNIAQKNYSLSLNNTASGQYVTLPSNQSAFSFGTGDFTIECWVYMNSLARRTIIDSSNASDATGTGRYLLEITAAGAVNLTTLAGTVILGGGTLAALTWYHVALVRASSVTKIYVNGTQVATVSDTTTYTVGTVSRPIIGVNGYDASSYPMSGYISNLRVVKGVAVYTGAFTPPTTPLKASQSSGTNIAAITTQTSLLTCQYNTLFDASNNKLALTRTGAPDMVNMYPFPT